MTPKAKKELAMAITIRLNGKEAEMVTRLRDKLALKNLTEVTRTAFRVLAEKEGV